MRGYTLIELLITITITTSLITFGISAYRKSGDAQLAKAQTETILATLAKAQKSATTGDMDCSSLYIGEQVLFVANSNTISITSICSEDSGTTKIITLPSTTFSQNYSLIFRPLNQGVDIGDNSSTNVDYQINNNSYRIEISQSGTIHVVGKI